MLVHSQKPGQRIDEMLKFPISLSLSWIELSSRFRCRLLHEDMQQDSWGEMLSPELVLFDHHLSSSLTLSYTNYLGNSTYCPYLIPQITKVWPVIVLLY